MKRLAVEFMKAAINFKLEPVIERAGELAEGAFLAGARALFPQLNESRVAIPVETQKRRHPTRTYK